MSAVETLSPADLIALSRLHRQALPESAFSLLGQGALEAYYEQIVSDPKDQVFVERAEGRIIGGCVLSYQPDRLATRTLRHRPLILLFAMARAFLGSGILRGKLVGFLRQEAPTPAAVEGLPEVVQIFTDDRYRNRKVGTRLLEQVASFLDNAPYFLKTEVSEDNKAIHFYRARGFEEVGIVESLGKRYVYYIKRAEPE